jgi:lysophospholipase L1-like esterase
MLECLIIGDSIGVGVSQFRKECPAYVQSGISSPGWIKKYGEKTQPTKVLIISLGANDYGINTLPNIERIRANAKADKVFWLLPRIERVPHAHEAVRKVAAQYGDVTLDRPKDVSPDGIHPTGKGYRELADKTRQ